MRTDVDIDVKPLRKALKRYMRVTSRGLGEVIDRQGVRLKWDLYREYKKIKPTKAEILSEAKSRDWRIKRKRGRTAMQEVRARQRNVGFLAKTLLFRGWRAKKGGQNLSIRKTDVETTAIVRTKKTMRPRITIESGVEGVVEQDKQKRIWNKAIKARAKDMMVYVNRRISQNTRRFNSGKRIRE